MEDISAKDKRRSEGRKVQESFQSMVNPAANIPFCSSTLTKQYDTTGNPSERPKGVNLTRCHQNHYQP